MMIPELNQQLIVSGIHYCDAFVQSILLLPEENRFQINLIWKDKAGKEIGVSKVYDTDYQKTWFLLEEIN